MMSVRYQDKILNPTVRLYAAAFCAAFRLMHDIGHRHRDALVKVCVETSGTAHMEWQAYTPDLNIFENLWNALGVLRIYVSPPPPQPLWQSFRLCAGKMPIT